MSYNAQQIYALAQYISFNQSAFPTIRIGNGIRHLEYNAQRGLDTQSYAFFEKMGTSVDKAVEAVSAHQYQLAHPKPTHAMPTSAPPEAPKRSVAVFVSCFTCKRDVAVPEEQADQTVFCSEACRNKAQQQQNSAVTELTKFMSTVGDLFYDVQFNVDLMVGYLRDHRKTVTEASLLEAFRALKGKLLYRLTAQEVNAMDSKTYEQRLRIDPAMGGLDTAAYRKYQTKTDGVN
jgi:hypothetical protein